VFHSLLSHLRRNHAPRIIDTVQHEALTYLDPPALLELYQAARELERRRVGGVFIEAGCALGGSAIVIAAAKARARPLYVYDVFDMIPSPSDKDGSDVQERYACIRQGQSKGIAGNPYYGYEQNLLEKVTSNFARLGLPIDRNNVRLVKGLFQDTIEVSQPVALAHLDGDWYESVMTCLSRIAPMIVSGGLLVIDDYRAWSGCKQAVDEYFADKRGQYEFREHARLHVVRL
jgi:hypothetical protein